MSLDSTNTAADQTADSSAVDASATDGTASSATQPLSLSEDSLVTIPGQAKPVKFGEWSKGLQSNQTKIAQERAELQREVERLRQESQRREAAGQPTTPNKRQQMIDNLKARTYLSGEEAAQTVDSILGEFETTISRRDEAIRLLAQKVMAMDQSVSGLRGQRAEVEFNDRVSNALKANGIPDEFNEFAQMVYLSHTGDSLDDEYPTLVKSFYDKFAAAVRKADKAKVDSAKQFRFPGKGGQGQASKQLDLSRATPKETADVLWDMVQGGDKT